MMVQPNRYYNLRSGETESPLGYIMQCLLESRVRLGLPSTVPEGEEINVYLGHLLVTVMTPVYRELCDRYVRATGTEIFERIEHSREAAEKFFVYRANADHRLLSGSVFRVPDTPPVGEEGSTYYHFAAEYHKQVHRRITPVSRLLEDLSQTFETYEAILTHMRHAYFQLWSEVSDENVQTWLRSLTPPASPDDNRLS